MDDNALDIERENHFPQQVVIEVTAACNQKCIFCGRTYMERPKQHMDQAIYHHVIDEIAAVSPWTEVWPTFMGEALLLGDKLITLLRYAKEAGCKKVTLNTNGTLLTKKMCDGLIASGLDRFIVSCDAHTPETHARVRPARRPGTPGLEMAYEGINYMMEAIEKRGNGPIIEMQFSIFEENEHEVEAFRRHWLSRGAIVKVRPKLHWSGVVEGGQERSYKDRTPCLWSLDTAAIQWNGNVVMCAVDCDGKYVAGNVERQTLSEIWNGPLALMRQLQLQKRFRELPEICRRCPDWQTKRAVADFPAESDRVRYEAYVREGRTFRGEPLSTTPAAQA